MIQVDGKRKKIVNRLDDPFKAYKKIRINDAQNLFNQN